MLCLEFLKNETLNIDVGKISFEGKTVQPIDSCLIEEWDWDTELFGKPEISENENLDRKSDQKLETSKSELCVNFAHSSGKSPKNEHSALNLDNPKLMSNKNDETEKKMSNWSLVCSDW